MKKVLLILLTFHLIPLSIFGQEEFNSLDDSINSNDDTLLPICQRHQACRAQISKFHIKPETTTGTFDTEEIEGSGEGSGQSFPFYDEFVDPLTQFDFDGSAEVTDNEICRCQNEEDTCDYSDESKVVDIDKSIKLTYCKPLKTQFPRFCDRRGITRVIGKAHPSGEALISVKDSISFCYCPTNTFRRMDIEPWAALDGYSFSYQCV
uniref:Secreted protein n=1 Tax=Rhabditophanes sp. KR3021 TaxID=114890 RepID=A0AC35UA11_9BILA